MSRPLSAALLLALALPARAQKEAFDSSRAGPDEGLAAAAPALALRRSDFPRRFIWGAATAAYQVEGGNKNSDLWDWERRRGWERSGAAVDSFRMVEEDVRLLRELGVNAYRFSIEWGRVMPAPGRFDESALAYYDKLIGLLEGSGIAPIVTIHHFTNPRWFWKRHPKGWSDPSAIDDYAAFVEVLARRYAGRVDRWVTFNEPMGYLMNGYVAGNFPPGERSVGLKLPADFMPAVRNIALAHRRAYRLIHAADPRPEVQVGLVQNPSPVFPWKDEARQRAAAARWDHFFHWNLLDAAAGGALDFDLDGKPDTTLDDGRPALDFVGINYYSRVYVRDLPALQPVRALPFYPELRRTWLGRLVFALTGGRLGSGPKDDGGREIYPDGLRLISRQAWDRYRLPILITENGVDDARDVLRAGYLRAHLRALKGPSTRASGSSATSTGR